jgi:Heterokaryon incompatibility protein (HET)
MAMPNCHRSRYDTLKDLLFEAKPTDNPAAIDVPGRILHPLILNNDIVTMIKKWQFTCGQSHSGCLQRAYRPKRLLHVGGGDVSHLTLQSCHESSTPNVPEYAALSYMWGGPQRFLTLKDNLEIRMARIELEDLPRTLRDAVLVCRALGMQWLWIDALCIIQDDPQDKYEQIKTMGEVFQSAALTIIPATSLGSDEGFLFDTFNSATLPFQRFRFVNSDGKGGSICMIKKQSNAPRFPIETRGWTMQERLLSTRLLFFHPGRIDWVCRESHLFAGSSSSYSVNLIDVSVTRGNSTFGAPDINSGVNRQIQHWYFLIRAFSERKLSNPRDRLPALSGIAKEFRQNFPALGDYVAGLWTTNLAQQLLWRIEYNAEWKCGVNGFMGPSWSWVSIENAFMFPATADIQAATRLEIIDHEIQYVVGSDRYGLLSAASLKVRGRLKPAQWNISTQKIESPDGLIPAGNPETIADSQEFASQGPLAGSSVHVYCLEIQDARYWARGLRTNLSKVFTGLLLFKFPDVQSTYRRAGVFSLAKADEDESSRAGLEAATKNLAWFEDVEPQVITIV